jgi:hypothetical protein
MRKVAEDSLANSGRISHCAPGRLDAAPACDNAEKTPESNESPLQAYSRLRS